ncbi:MAG: Mobile element protein [uncultured Gemmatimonadaceae bacterium]|uniref:Mobile element protein n=1 Tax=uncultured Gemmatimonadaceae bacterium TaxID=246130 RepID=A0A6J4KMB9_9BACT|nr:MAG: Mobile element protein [uncultured Gemmatimonadaceae bacterium]
MTARLPCPPAPGPLEAYAAGFDPLFRTLAQRRGFREYLAGLLLPRDRNKTLTALAAAEPVVGAQGAAVQRLQFFLSEAAWDAEAVTAARIARLVADPFTAPHAEGVLVLDDTGDRKDGTATAHVARQYLGSVGKIDNGIVAVTSLWADARVYYPLHVAPYTTAGRLPHGKQDPAFRTKPQIALALVDRAHAAGVPFRAAVADSAYGDNLELERALVRADVPHVLAHRGAVGRCWAPADVAHSFAEAIEALPREAWVAVERHFRGGRTEAWWAAELSFAGYGPEQPTRAVVATTDRDALPALSTWYLSTNLPAAEAPLAEVVRLYGLRVWVEEGYKRVKGELGWADFQVRSDRAIRRHWALVCCAFSFCWAHEGQRGAPNHPPVSSAPLPAPEPPARGENRGVTRRRGHVARAPLLAGRAAARARLAGPVGVARALLARVGQHAPAAGAGSAPRRRRGRARAQPLRPDLTNHR